MVDTTTYTAAPIAASHPRREGLRPTSARILRVGNAAVGGAPKFVKVAAIVSLISDLDLLARRSCG